jgi:hypothetical protein
MKILETISFDAGEFCLLAETEQDKTLLRRLIDLREHTSLRAVSWQIGFEPSNRYIRTGPNLTKRIARLDLRLVENALFEALPKPGYHGPDDK